MLAGISLFVYVNLSPVFPAHVPSSEDSATNAEAYRERKKLFERYTRTIEENHGGLLLAEETKPSLSGSDISRNGKTEFLHRYKYFDKKLIFNLTKHFSQQEKLGYRILEPKPAPGLSASYRFKIEFIFKTEDWVGVFIQTTDSIVEQYEEPMIKETVDLEPAESDGDIHPKVPVRSEDNVGKLAIIIDDLGYSMGILYKFVELKYPLTYSILPNLEYTLETAELIRENNYEMLLHLPMQPEGWPGINPGPGALMIEDNEEVLARKLEINLLSVRYAVGANNHMGSAFTKYGEGLESVMEILKREELFFVDSKTAPGNAARDVAYRYKVPYLSRNIFLDNHQDEEKIKRQLYKAVDIAKRYGQAIAIGHPYLSTLRVLAGDLPILERRGIRVVPVSSLI